MHLKIHTVLPGYDFKLNSSLNLFPFPAVLNKLFRRAVNFKIEATPALRLEEARKLCLFEQGWLPDILPPSTHHIQLVKCPKINFAQGDLFFSPCEWKDFSSKLDSEMMIEETSGKTVDAPFVNWAKSLRKMQREGHTLWHYCSQGRHWMFFCKANEGYCEYVMWMIREETK